MSVLGYIFNIVIALFFCIAVSTKVGSVYNFQLEVASYRVVPKRLLPAAGYIVLTIEFLLILTPIFNLAGIWRQIVCISLLAAFSYMTWGGNSGRDQHVCSCFGQLTFLNKFPLLRNTILILITTISMILPEYRPSIMVSFQILLLIVWISLLLQLLSSSRRGSGVNGNSFTSSS